MGSRHDGHEENRYRDIVESHLQNRLPQEGFHSSFDNLTSRNEPKERPSPPAYSHTDTRLPNIVVLGDQDSDLTEDDRDLPRLSFHTYALICHSTDTI